MIVNEITVLGYKRLPVFQKTRLNPISFLRSLLHMSKQHISKQKSLCKIVLYYCFRNNLKCNTTEELGALRPFFFPPSRFFQAYCLSYVSVCEFLTWNKNDYLIFIKMFLGSERRDIGIV